MVRRVDRIEIVLESRARASEVVRNGWIGEVGEDIGVGALGFVIGGLARDFSPRAKTHVQ